MTKLLQEEKFISSLINELDKGIIVVDKNFNILFQSSNIKDILMVNENKIFQNAKEISDYFTSIQISQPIRLNNCKAETEIVLCQNQRFIEFGKRKIKDYLDIELWYFKVTNFLSDYFTKKIQEESNQLIEDLESLGKIGHWSIDYLTQEVNWSPECYKILAFDPNKFTPSIESAKKYIHPDDYKDFDNKIVEGNVENLNSELTWVSRFIKEDGRIIYLRVNAHIKKNDKSEAIAIFGIFQDITKEKLHEELLEKNQNENIKTSLELQKTESYFRALFETLNDGVIIINHLGYIVTTNPAITKILGYKVEDLIGKNISLLMPSPHQEMHDQYIQTYLRTGVSTILKKGREVIGITKSGESIPFFLSISEIKYDNKIFFAGILRDISKEKAYQNLIIKQKEIAQEASQAKSQFLGHISHELRTPLNIIKGYAQILERSIEQNPKAHQQIQEIKKASDHLLDLIKNILDLSQIEAKKNKLHLEKLKLSDVLKTLLGQVEPEFIAKGIKLSLDIQENDYILGDLTKIRQIIYNLISNAIKYSDSQGEIKIELRTTASKQIHLSITNWGEYIEQDQIPHVFLPFNRFSKHSTTSGSGIGLVITKELVTLHRGSIEFKSDEKEGTVFTVEFPPLYIQHFNQPIRFNPYLFKNDNYNVLLWSDQGKINDSLQNSISHFEGLHVYTSSIFHEVINFSQVEIDLLFFEMYTSEKEMIENTIYAIRSIPKFAKTKIVVLVNSLPIGLSENLKFELMPISQKQLNVEEIYKILIQYLPVRN
jgi:PAS domain S-box-containing protein